jgi:Tannase and feruloyl esterase
MDTIAVERTIRHSACRFRFIGGGAVLAAYMLACAGYSNAASCENLTGLKLPGTEITMAKSVRAGEFVSPEPNLSPDAVERYKKLPAFCRVIATLKPTSDSDIKIEVWLPVSGWNHKFQGEGNGGFAGSLPYGLMAGALAQGYATAGTDTGHVAEGTDALWALGHPEKIADFGYRGIHEMSDKAKQIVKAYYAAAPHRSYFVGCSDGGREALMEAQRFPNDYDGILAGAPANYWTHLLTTGADVAKTVLGTPGGYIPASKIPAIAAATVSACDALDGVKDGILNEPVKCHFDAATLLCKGAESDRCLTAPQVASLKKLYAGGRTSNGTQFFPGFEPGGEDGDGGWKPWITGTEAGESDGNKFVKNFFRYMVFNDPAWTYETADIDATLRTADQNMASVLNATDANLSPLQKRGGKLIIYHGWSDAAIPPQNAIEYFQSVNSALGEKKTSQFVRLYMVPGMQHCIGGPGPSLFGQFSVIPGKTPKDSIYLALEQWVEKGVAPDQIITAKFKDGDPSKGIEMTRPLCPYPQVAVYKGTGDTNAAASFVCQAGR